MSALLITSVEGPITRTPERIRVADVIHAVARVWDVPAAQVLSEGRIRVFTHPRFAVYWIAHVALARPSTQVGAIVGRDHGSVLSGVRTANTLCARDPQFRALLVCALRDLQLPTNGVPLPAKLISQENRSEDQ
jgi:chromosomal replication initiation ATPase DnaA